MGEPDHKSEEKDTNYWLVTTTREVIQLVTGSQLHTQQVGHPGAATDAWQHTGY